jgi:hypothetical protein
LEHALTRGGQDGDHASSASGGDPAVTLKDPSLYRVDISGLQGGNPGHLHSDEVYFAASAGGRLVTGSKAGEAAVVSFV